MRDMEHAVRQCAALAKHRSESVVRNDPTLASARDTPKKSKLYDNFLVKVNTHLNLELFCIIVIENVTKSEESPKYVHFCFTVSRNFSANICLHGIYKTPRTALREQE
ncbi:MAG: hypothetical protein NZ455_03035 [Bacteroidia bacterium]|nr:hypothetical protein [Bacteroidia bacterium]